LLEAADLGSHLADTVNLEDVLAEGSRRRSARRRRQPGPWTHRVMVVAVVAVILAAIFVPLPHVSLFRRLITPAKQPTATSVPTTVPKTPPIGTRLAKLKLPDNVGDSMAISGNTIVIGGAGRAIVFAKTATGWTQTAELKVANRSVSTIVAISGDTIVVGGNQGFNAAYVFSKTAAGWKRVAELKAPGGVASVATSGTIVVVGEGYGGTPYVFSKTAAGWKQVAELKDFGPSIALSGTTAVVSGPSCTCRAAVFTKAATGWRQVADLRLAAGDFVDSLASSATTAVISTFTKRPESLGHTYVFTKTATGWRQVAQLKGSSAGGDVAISGTTWVEGAPGAANGTGRAYVFIKTATGWKQVAELKGSDTPAYSYSFGQSVAMSGRTAIVSGIGRVAYVFQA
jgi:hypothetical protein